MTVEILDDAQFEPDEQFYIRLCLIDGAKSQSVDVMLGRIFVMEITILNDDGIYFLFFNDCICIIPPPYSDVRNYAANESIENDHLSSFFLLWDNNVDNSSRSYHF